MSFSTQNDLYFCRSLSSCGDIFIWLWIFKVEFYSKFQYFISFIVSFKYDIVGIDFLFRRGNVDVIRCGLFPSSLLQVYYYFGSRK